MGELSLKYFISNAWICGTEEFFTNRYHAKNHHQTTVMTMRLKILLDTFYEFGSTKHQRSFFFHSSCKSKNGELLNSILLTQKTTFTNPYCPVYMVSWKKQNKKYTTIFLPILHFLFRQVDRSWLAPTQYLPLFLGTGLLHCLVRLRWPLSHVLEQVLHDDHIPQLPLTGAEKWVEFIIPFLSEAT